MFGKASKWLIVKRNGRWAICPPVVNSKGELWPNGKQGAMCDTGAEAHAAYAAGADTASMADRRAEA